MRLLRASLITVLVALMAALAVHIAGRDAYLDDGTSRWSSRSDDVGAQVTLWATGALFLGTLAVLVRARSGRPAVMTAGVVLAAVTIVGFVFTLFAFTSN
jgi:hypothetical protein